MAPITGKLKFWRTAHNPNTDTNLLRNKIALAILIGLAILFFVIQYLYSTNAPRALDDSRMYLLHFTNRFLDADSFIAKVRYFFSQTNYPHTKLTGRIIAFLYYSVSGTVNFKFLIMVGTLALIGFVFLTKRIMNLEYFAVIPLALILFTPSKVTFWVGPITGYPFLLIYSLLCYYCLAHQRYWTAIFIAVVASFTHSPGMVIFIAAIPMFFLPENRNRWIFMWIGAACATFAFYYFEVISQGRVLRVREPRTLMNLLQCSGSMIVYEGKFLTLPFEGNFYGLGDVSRMQKPAGFISLGVLGMITAILIAKWRSFDKRMAIACAVLLFCLAPGPISTLVSDKCDTLMDRVAPRYLMYALMSWCGILVFMMSLANKKWRVIILVLFSIAFMPKVYEGYSKVEVAKARSDYRWIKRATYHDGSKRGLIERDILKKSRKRGLYSAPLPKYRILKSPNTAAPNKKLELWYDYSLTPYFCKINTLVEPEDIETVEVWFGSPDSPTRYLPKKVPALHVYNWAKTKGEFPYSRRKAKAQIGYQFTQSAENGCDDEFRLKVGDALSDVLVPTP